jgi:hypothetical protein
MSEVKCQLESAPKRIATMLQSFSFLKFQEVCWIFQSTYDSQHFITIKSVSKKLIYKKNCTYKVTKTSSIVKLVPIEISN